MEREVVFMDLSVNERPVGRIVIELFQKEVPKAAENFRCLCTGERGVSRRSGKVLCYKGSTFHRVIKGFMLQGGDITHGDGSGGESVFEGGDFEDEFLDRPLDQAGLVCMANRGPNTNGSQFFITAREATHLNGKNVVVGRVVKGYHEILDVLLNKGKEEEEEEEEEGDVGPIRVEECGELVLRLGRNVRIQESITSTKTFRILPMAG
ncbi:MAG: cyclophilin-like domain-containing protein [Piptocephalis tieghemiana]|nr:MAG: cyclophilin-like domain-containing protein [Piptocephalis tieghemiana]